MRWLVGSSASGRRLVATAFVLGLSAWGLTTTATGAVFTGTATATSKPFTTGTVELTPGATTAAVTATDLKPGDRVVVPLTVSNTGTLQFRYSLSVPAPGIYQSDAYYAVKALRMTIKADVASCTIAGFGASGTIVYGPDEAGGSSELRVFGDRTAGLQAGERVLAAGASETLCFNLELPVNASPVTDGGRAATITLRLFAEQDRNNT